MPREWPTFSKKEIRALRGKSYQDIAFTVLLPFVEGDIPADTFRAMIDEAYATFRHPAIAARADGTRTRSCWSSSTARRPPSRTRAQLLARLMDHALGCARRARHHRRRHLDDTAGPPSTALPGAERTGTSSASPEPQGLAGAAAPETTSHAEATQRACHQGQFRRLPDLVKAMFNDAKFRDRVKLSSVNSINRASWPRSSTTSPAPWRSAGRTGRSLHRADRQFRRHLCGLRQAHGPADRQAGHRHQRERHSRPHAEDRPLRDEGRQGHHLAVHGYPDLVELRAPAVRGLRS